MDVNYKVTLNRIKTFFFDVDGVFTDSIVHLLSNGEQVRSANVKDGYAVQLAIKKGFRVVIISGGNQEAVRLRFNGLGVKDVFLGVKNKVKTLENYLEEHQLDTNHCLYMGDDIPDYYVMKKVALPCCPSNAAPEIKSISKYISPLAGGKGCVRDIIEQTLKAQNNWMNDRDEEW